MLITPYRQQRDLLQEELRRVGAAAAEVTVCTVDGAQGQEADVVIISLVKAKPSRFLDKRRLCVMLSRARRTLVLVGDRGSHSNCQCAPLAEVASRSPLANQCTLPHRTDTPAGHFQEVPRGVVRRKSAMMMTKKRIFPKRSTRCAGTAYLLLAFL
jgi:hypothetical protein